MKALGIVLVILLALAGLAYRPATVIGVHGDALANSVAGLDLFGSSKCLGRGGDRWRCEIENGSGTTPYAIETHSFGCWDATRIGRSGEPMPKKASGCIDALDVLNPL
jgi:hypothetical protein